MNYYKSESPSRAGGEAAVQNSTQGSWGGQKEAQGVPKWQKGPKTGRGGESRGRFFLLIKARQMSWRGVYKANRQGRMLYSPVIVRVVRN